MPSPSNFDLKILEVLPSSIEGFIKLALLCIGILILYKIYENKRWN